MKKKYWVILAFVLILLVGGLMAYIFAEAETDWQNPFAPARIDGVKAAVVVPKATPVPTEVMPEPTVPATAVVPEASSSTGWKTTWYPTADKDRGDGITFRQSTAKWIWREVAPGLWPTFPNVPNPLVPEFPVVKCADDPTKDCVPDGLEYAMDETNFCQQLAGESCRVPVAAEHYFYFSGDYNIPGIGACKAEGREGCMLVINNVGRVTSDFTGLFGQGFRLHARYFNGQALDMATWGLVSLGSNSMLNMGSQLNKSGQQNAGANCSVPEGCQKVDIRVVFVSGNEPMLMLETQVSR